MSVGTEPILTVSDQDVLDNWLSSEKTVHRVSGGDDIEILPQSAVKNVSYSSYVTDYMAYDPQSDKVYVGKKCLGLSEGVLGAMFRHEKCHSVFGRLPQEEQSQIVSLLLLSSRDQLQDFFEACRDSAGYDEEYFGLKKAQMVVEKTKEFGRGKKLVMPEIFSHGNGVEEIDVVTLVDELLAFFATSGSRKEVLEGARDWQETVKLASEIVDQLPLETKNYLESFGLLNLTSDDLLGELNADEHYQEVLHRFKNGEPL